MPTAGPPVIAPPVDVMAGSEFTALLRQVKDRGLLERRIGSYVLNITTTLLALAAVWTGIVLVGDSWWTLLLAVPAAVFTTRSSFIGHDAGHQQIARTRSTNRLIGLLHGNLMLGMSYAWWNDKHNRHHANPNHIDKDPDVEVGALVWTRAQACERQGFARWLTRHQARLFLPMLLLEGFALKVASIRFLWRQPPRERIAEAVVIGVHLCAYVTVLLMTMSPGKALVFAFVHHALYGLHLGSAFAPNHKGMPMPNPGERWGHLRRQVLTSRNVRGGLATDWFLGGRNYQVEHHLFPNMPRANLRIAQPLVREHCRLMGLPYTEAGLFDSYRIALRHMHEVGAPLRAA
jgi:fatty acid desaturase